MDVIQKISFRIKKKSHRLPSCFFSLLLLLIILLPIFSSCVKAGEQQKEKQALDTESKSGKKDHLIRPPTVSGQFYPVSPSKLKGTIRDFLKLASPQEDSGKLIALVCPHAGYKYSGEIAAYSYKLLEGKKINTVILMGPSHRFPLRGASVWPGGAYQTPLGEVKINEKVAAIITKSSESITFEPKAHLQEHSLEVQIPFLQVILQEFQIVPILIGRLSPQAFEDIGRQLAILLEDPGTILIISTDLSHYHSYDDAVAMDKNTLKTIQARECDKLKAMVSNGEAELCGVMPVLLLLETIKHIKHPTNIRLLKYANSGDTAGMREGVVG